MSDDLNYDALDPGVRDVVRKLRAAGFETTDSGDGKSKADLIKEGCALDFAHVFSVVPKDLMCWEAERMQDLLGADWKVEASWAPGCSDATLIAREPTKEERTCGG